MRFPGTKYNWKCTAICLASPLLCPVPLRRPVSARADYLVTYLTFDLSLIEYSQKTFTCTTLSSVWPELSWKVRARAGVRAQCFDQIDCLFLCNLTNTSLLKVYPQGANTYSKRHRETPPLPPTVVCRICLNTSPILYSHNRSLASGISLHFTICCTAQPVVRPRAHSASKGKQSQPRTRVAQAIILPLHRCPLHI